MKWLLFVCGLFGLTAQAEEIKYGDFGRVEIRRGGGKPERLVMLLSEGTKSAVAERLAKEEGQVVAVIGPHYLATLSSRTKRKCVYPAGDFELLSKYLQTKLKFAVYRPPALVGEGAAAALVYGALAQAPKNTFAGAVSVKFCPSWEEPKSFCAGYGLKSTKEGKGFALAPYPKPLPGWRVAGAGKACAKSLPNFVGKVSGAVHAEASGPAAIADSLESLAAQEKAVPVFKGDASIEELPLVEVPAAGSASGTVILYSGDGGWAGFDQDLAASLAAKGNRVLGLSTLKYFWSPRTPEAAADDLGKLIRFVNPEKTGPLRLVGYSFGADVLPELVSRLSPALRAQVKSLSLLGLSDRATFEFHFTDWIGGSGEGLPIEPVLKRLSPGVAVRCLYGDDESDSLCARLDPKKVGVFKLPGGHHFDGDSEALSKIILQP